MVCPICLNADAEVNLEKDSEGKSKDVKEVRCSSCGNFKISGPAENELNQHGLRECFCKEIRERADQEQFPIIKLKDIKELIAKCKGQAS